MQTCQLGQSDISVSRIAFGCWAIVGGFNWGHQEEQDSLAALQAGYDAGITLFDTAEAYGNGRSEELLAKALGNVRQNIVIASKVSSGHLRPADIRTACENSLRRLNTDYIDLYQIHWPSPDVPLEATLGEMLRLREEGKIRAVGVSNFGRESLDTAFGYTDIITNQVSYNLLFRAIEYDIQPLCRDHHCDLLCYSPLMQGLLTGKFNTADEVPADRARTRHFRGSREHCRHGEGGAEAETFRTIDELRAAAEEEGVSLAEIALAWPLRQSAVGCVIAGARNPAQAAANAGAGEVSLSADLLRRLDRLTAPLKEKLGENPDLWQAKSRVF